MKTMTPRTVAGLMMLANVMATATCPVLCLVTAPALIVATARVLMAAR